MCVCGFFFSSFLFFSPPLCPGIGGAGKKESQTERQSQSQTISRVEHSYDPFSITADLMRRNKSEADLNVEEFVFKII